MATDLLAKAAISAAAAGLVLALLRRAGPRAGGLAAAVPVTSMPVLYWLAAERGAGYAAAAAAGSLWGTFASAVMAWLGAAALMRRAAPWPAPLRLHPRGRALLSMGAAGTLSLVVGVLSRHAGPVWCGLVAAVPVVALTTTFVAHRHGGAATAGLFLRGYLDGMFAKAVFLGTLGAAWVLGAGAAAWPLALAGAATTVLVQGRRTA
jgi:hypothetical protein